MADTRNSRADTPRSRAPQRTSQAARRASSVPAVGTKRPEYILDCVLMTPRKRKRTTSHEDLPSGPASQSQPQSSRLGAFAHLQKKLPARSTRSRARSTEKSDAPYAPSSSRTSPARRKRASSSNPAPDRVTRSRAASMSRATGDPVAGPSSSTAQRRRTSSRASAKPAPPSRASASSRRNKGKARVSQVAIDFETSSNPDMDEDEDAPFARSAKRRRLSPQLLLAPDSPEFSPTGTVVGAEAADSGETAVEEDFQMLDMPDDASLPWVQIDPQSKESAYVPPGLNALIEDMKRALVLQMSARQKAEALHAEELQRRRALEHEAARLAAANRALEEERSVWTASAAEALACNLESALVADMSRRRAPPHAFSAETETDAEMSESVGRAGPLGGGRGAGPLTMGPQLEVEGVADVRSRRGRPGELGWISATQR
ncbi:hypothetical protein VTO73DRAFT_1239 [Trametes versicolor]